MSGSNNSNGTLLQMLNRPLLHADLAALAANRHSAGLRALAQSYKQAGLPVMNGGFHYSNLMEGPGQMLTCLPYRLWEYSSVFALLDDGTPAGNRRFLDVGGAASPLVFYLAEQGYHGVTLDLQPLLVDLTSYVARVRGLPLEACVRDITAEGGWQNEFDFIVFVSVLEHIEPAVRIMALQRMYEALKPGGFLYMTFDYGTYIDHETSYRKHLAEAGMTSGSIGDIGPLCQVAEQIGFRLAGNDPRALPREVLSLTAAPEHTRIARQRALNLTIDGSTPWRELLKYTFKRALGRSRVGGGRFSQHNFFRIFLRKPERP